MISQCIRKAIANVTEGIFCRSVIYANRLVNVNCMQKFYITSFTLSKKIPDHIVSDLDNVEKLWKQRPADDMIQPFLFQCFTKEENCFSYALTMIYHMTLNGKMNYILAYSIFNSLHQWTTQNSVSKLLTIQLKTEALILALRKGNLLLLRLVCCVYEITNEASYVNDIIQKLLSEGAYEEACKGIIALKMQREYPLEKVLLPLVPDGSFNTMKLYVEDHPDLQIQLACCLDNTLGRPQNSVHFKRSVSRDFIKRFYAFVKYFKIPQENYPNLCSYTSNMTLNTLIRKKYSEASPTLENWEDMVTTVVRDNPFLQMRLVRRLVSENDFIMAKKMAKKFEIPAEKWPDALHEKEASEVSCIRTLSEKSEQAAKGKEIRTKKMDEEVSFLTLPLERSNIKCVSTAEEFEDCMHDLTNNHHILGIDAEWKCFGLNKNRLSLMQLAVSEKVYLLDILSLDECLWEHHWDSFIDDIFGNPNILKLGCSLMCDVMMLLQGSKGTKGRKMKFTHLLDIAVFFQKLLSVCPDLVPGYVEDVHSSKNTKGLSKICHVILGFPLDKNNQTSDWEIRPLTESQIMYGALDAYCLLQIYDKINVLALERKLDFNKLLDVSIGLSSSFTKDHMMQNRKSMKWSKQSQGFDVQPAIRMREFKVSVDNSLKDLGKKLRMFGADVEFLPDVVDDDMIEASKEDSRIILTGGSLLEQLEECMVEGMYYNIPENFRNSESIVAHVVQRFNVKLDSRDIYQHYTKDDMDS